MRLKPYQGRCDFDFIRLCLFQIVLAAFYHIFMNLLTMTACASQPVSNRSFIQPKGFDDRLNWTAIRQKNEHLDRQFRRMPQTIENGAFGSRTSLPVNPIFRKIYAPPRFSGVLPTD